MVRMVKDTAGMYRTNIIAVNPKTSEEQPIIITRSQKNCALRRPLWDLVPLTEKLESRSECENLLERLVKGPKKYDDWVLKYDPNFNYKR